MTKFDYQAKEEQSNMEKLRGKYVITATTKKLNQSCAPYVKRNRSPNS